MLQFNQGKKTKKVLGLRQDAEKTFIAQLDMAVDKVTLAEHVHDFATNQGKLRFIKQNAPDSSDAARHHCVFCWQMHHTNSL